MALPGNGIFVVHGEMSTLMTAMRRGSRWNSSAYDEDKNRLMKLFVDLKQILNHIEDLQTIEPNVFLTPFLEVIRTDETTGAVTSLALSAISKFLSYGLIDPTMPSITATVEHIVDAVTHARFMGTDQSSDGVTLFRVVEVLHTLMRNPEGSFLSNEAVREMMMSCFKISFEPRLSELLRRSAEQTLKDMVLMLFTRLPQFADDQVEGGALKKFQMNPASLDRKPIKSQSTISLRGPDDPHSPQMLGVPQLKAPPLATTPATPAGNILDMQGKITNTPTTATSITANPSASPENTPTDATTLPTQENGLPTVMVESVENAETQELLAAPVLPGGELNGSSEYVNSVGVRFTQNTDAVAALTDMGTFTPYGLPCIHELFWFLIMLCDAEDKQNSDIMMHTSLSLLTVAFEVGADNIGKCDTLLKLVKDNLCRYLIALMNSERLTIFAANLQLCFLIFESLRGHLKFQLEAYLRRLTELIATENPKVTYEMRELAMDNLLQLCRMPGFVAELYINYDCNLYCSDTFEGLINLLSKFTLSATSSIYSTHIIAMDTLMMVIEHIERNCTTAKGYAVTEPATDDPLAIALSDDDAESAAAAADPNADDTVVLVVAEQSAKLSENALSVRLAARGGQVPPSVTRDLLLELKRNKRVFTQGTELFNQRPDKGIQYLQENGILRSPLDPMEVARFLRENPGLDKKMIGEYISKKKNVDSKILLNFVNSFEFGGLRIDQALRLYLETFRLPGEAPLIFLVLEHFADHWHTQNGEPFANTDAAFSLAYAVIMLNMDQHNSNAKRLNVPMTPDDFLKNLRGLNGGSDYEQAMLVTVFNEIKNEEIVMPAEQTGLVRENYLWKVLLRRGASADGVFHYVQDAVYDMDLFKIIWGAALSTLSFMFDKSSDTGYQRTLTSFTKCARILAHYNLHAEFDALVLTLCKFTTLLHTTQPDNSNSNAPNEIAQAVAFGLNVKAQAAMRAVFGLVHDYGDTLRDGWRHIFELYLQLFRLKLLPRSLVEVEDFCEPSGKLALTLRKPCVKQEASLLSSLYSYLSSDGQREPSFDEQEFIKIGKSCIRECQLEQMLQETKFLQLESLQELFRTLLALIKAPTCAAATAATAAAANADQHEHEYADDVVVFWIELLVRIVIQNRDRMAPLWRAVRDQMYGVIGGGATYGYEYLLHRSIVALFKLASYLMRNEELCPMVLQSLKIVLLLHSSVILQVSKQISIGIYELLRTSAQNIHSEKDWDVIFTVLECVGAGAVPELEAAVTPPSTDNGGSRDGDATSPDCGALSGGEEAVSTPGYASDSDVVLPKQQQNRTNAENWILVNKDTDLTVLSRPQSPPSKEGSASSLLAYHCHLIEHSPFALFKCWDSLVFIVRNVAHITPYNFESCVRCIRTFVEACCDAGMKERLRSAAAAAAAGQQSAKKRGANRRAERKAQAAAEAHDAGDARSDTDEQDLAQRYETLSIQLLDLMYTLYTRTAKIFRWWAEEGGATPQCSALWAQGWCPLLQGMARLATDRRREVRTYAISCLQQRALLMPDLQTLSGAEWAACFRLVLFPLLNELLPESSTVTQLEPVLLEESRIRMATIMSKVFLHHLTPLIDLGDAFNDLWLDVLDYIERFMKVGSDQLVEQMQEILKNMLLVMHSVRLFHNEDGTLQVPLWELTWRRIGEFLPSLKGELFGHGADDGSGSLQNQSRTEMRSTALAAATTIAAGTPASVLSPTQQYAAFMANQQQQPTQAAGVESPRLLNNIILAPPADIMASSLYADANRTQLSTPFLVAQQQPAAVAESAPSASPSIFLYDYGAVTTVHPVALPDIVNDASKLVQPTSATVSPVHSAVAPQQPATMAAYFGSDYSISIDVPEMPTTDIYGGQLAHSPDATTPAVQSDEAADQQRQYFAQLQQQFYQQQEQHIAAVGGLPAGSQQYSNILTMQNFASEIANGDIYRDYRATAHAFELAQPPQPVAEEIAFVERHQ